MIKNVELFNKFKFNKTLYNVLCDFKEFKQEILTI